MDDFDHIDEKLEREIVRAFGKAMQHWPKGIPTFRVPRMMPTDNTAVFTADLSTVVPHANHTWEFKRELVENVSGFPLTQYSLLCNGEWRLIAVHGRL